MYCPRCAAQNNEETRFCRQCGISLEAVALALTDGSPYDQAIIRRKKSAGLKKIVQGAGLVTISALLGVLLGVFSNQPDWIIIWLAMVGWLAVIGVISMSSGISKMLESRFVDPKPNEALNDTEFDEISPAANRDSLQSVVTASNLTLPSSVTDHTTNLLTEPRLKARPDD